ncbi:MAG: hypothetical protein KDA81_07010 [Planctomycetaceae bacterium]|nr:hypothetical protein [Planctomycetaceae bacterium]
MSNTLRYLYCCACLLAAAGCGATQQRIGTEQLLLSDSVDRTVDQLDFSILSGRKVFLDTTYVNPTAVKGQLFVNSDYIVSAMRHKLSTSGCMIQSSRDSADYVIEPRVGALGMDALEVTYGIPASSALSQAANAVAGVPAVPAIPEISVGKRNAAMSTSKIVVYAYHRETGTVVWQSGNAVARSDAKDTWVMGAGPLQRGTIYKSPRFAGSRLRLPRLFAPKPVQTPSPLTIADSHQFIHPAVLEQQLLDAREQKAESPVVPVNHESTEKPAEAEKKQGP